MADLTEDQIHEEIYGKSEQVARFVSEAVIDRVATEKLGHKVYVPTPYVTIRAKGERDGISVPVTKEHKLRFKREWDAYTDACTKPRETSVYYLPTIEKYIIRTLEDLGINTIEQLAAAPIAERVEVPLHDDEDENAEEIPLPGVLPAYLAKWQRIARAYLNLKQFAMTGEKPRVKLEAVA